MLEQLSDDIHKAIQQINDLDGLDGDLQYIKCDAIIKLAAAYDVLRALSITLDRFDPKVDCNDEITLESIQEGLQKTWFELLGERYALQDQATGLPSDDPIRACLRCTTQACNRLNDVIADLGCAQRALDERSRWYT